MKETQRLTFTSHHDEHSDGPPRNVLSNETIRNALERAAQANTAASGKSPSPKESSRSHKSKSSKTEKHVDCECIDCRKPKRQGTTRTAANGDTVKEWDGEGSPELNIHVQPGLFDDVEAEPPRRTSTGGSSRSSKKHSSKSERHASSQNTATTRNREGDLVQNWSGSGAPPISHHYDWDAPENQPKH